MSKYVALQCDPPNQDKWRISGVLDRLFDDKSLASAEAERLQQSWDSMLEWIYKSDGLLQELNTKCGEYIGLIKHIDKYHIVQSTTGHGAFGIHLISSLSQAAVIEQNTRIKYKDGLGNVESKSIDGKGRGGVGDR